MFPIYRPPTPGQSSGVCSPQCEDFVRAWQLEYAMIWIVHVAIYNGTGDSVCSVGDGGSSSASSECSYPALAPCSKNVKKNSHFFDRSQCVFRERPEGMSSGASSRQSFWKTLEFTRSKRLNSSSVRRPSTSAWMFVLPRRSVAACSLGAFHALPEMLPMLPRLRRGRRERDSTKRKMSRKVPTWHVTKTTPAQTSWIK